MPRFFPTFTKKNLCCCFLKAFFAKIPVPIHCCVLFQFLSNVHLEVRTSLPWCCTWLARNRISFLVHFPLLPMLLWCHLRSHCGHYWKGVSLNIFILFPNFCFIALICLWLLTGCKGSISVVIWYISLELVAVPGPFHFLSYLIWG